MPIQHRQDSIVHIAIAQIPLAKIIKIGETIMKYYMTTNRRNNMTPVSLFDSFFGDKFFATNAKTMATDIIDREDSYDLVIEMAGYDKGNITLDYADEYLTVSATRESDTSYIRRESATTCSRRYYVGELDDAKIKAKYDNGVLVVSLPKEHLAKKNTTIAID